jgi:hypothetical protein
MSIFSTVVHKPTETIPALQTLVREQDHIGWQHLWSGRASEEWAYAQTRYLKQTKHYDPTKGRTGAGWIVKTLHFLMQSIRKAWLLRNNVLKPIPAYRYPTVTQRLFSQHYRY